MLFHQPNIMIMETVRPGCAVVMAAPVRKLCPTGCSCGRPNPLSVASIISENLAFVNGFPFGNLRNGSCDVLLCAVNCTYSGDGPQAVLGSLYCDINLVFELVGLKTIELGELNLSLAERYDRRG